MSCKSKSTLEDLLGVSRSDLRGMSRADLEELCWCYREELRKLANRFGLNSQTSSKPPSSDSPFDRPFVANNNEPQGTSGSAGHDSQNDQNQQPAAPDTKLALGLDPGAETSSPLAKARANKEDGARRKPGKQPGAPGMWRRTPIEPQEYAHHRPLICEACDAPLDTEQGGPAHSAHYVFELERKEGELRVTVTKHIYYSASCPCCGHTTTEKPGVGLCSTIEGRKKNLQLSERNLIGPMLTTFIGALAARFRMSRRKIQEFLRDWLGVEISIGTIDRCIHEFGRACQPVVEDLIKEVQQETESAVVHIDETVWYENGKGCWLWVLVTASTAIFMVGTRSKQELVALIGEAFLGWLVTDGYMAYRDHPRRQRCLAHLIRKARALAEGYYGSGCKFGHDLMRDLRALIHEIAEGRSQDGPHNTPRVKRLLARIKWTCQCNQDETEEKVRALAREILNDWEAVIAFVDHPDLPPTNNDAERTLRQVVIARLNSFGTRTREGSNFYTASLSVIETCLRRGVDPWAYVCQLIIAARKGLPHPPMPPPLARTT
jgi:transposase